MSSVSVIIPTYNRRGSLQRTLGSVMAQHHPPDEIIVVDDGSTDGTEQMVAQEFPQVDYYRQANRGVSAARNVGIGRASGQWLALLDSDDQWRPEKLEKQLAAIKAATLVPKVIHTDEIWIRHGKRVNPMKKHAKAGGWIFQRCLPLCAISPSSVMVHRSVFEEVGLFDETLPACEDYDMWLRVSARYPVHYLDTPLIVKYGGHEDQLSRRYWGMDRFRIYALDKIIRSGWLAPGNEQAAREMILEKLRIYLQGAAKRDNKDEVARYLPLWDHYGGDSALLPESIGARERWST